MPIVPSNISLDGLKKDAAYFGLPEDSASTEHPFSIADRLSDMLGVVKQLEEVMKRSQFENMAAWAVKELLLEAVKSPNSRAWAVDLKKYETLHPQFRDLDAEDVKAYLDDIMAQLPGIRDCEGLSATVTTTRSFSGRFSVANLTLELPH